MKLYEIAKEYEQIINELYDDEGNENPQALAKLEANEIAMEKKAIAIASWIKNMIAEKEAIAEAKRNMYERERSLSKRIDNWKQYIKENMERRGISEIKCPYFILKIKKNPQSVDDYNFDEIPNEYKKVSVELDKAKLRLEMMNGVIIPGARLKQDTGLQIK
jgi:Gp157 protein